MNEQDNFRESYNVHDPHNQHKWADEEESVFMTVTKIVVGGVVMVSVFWAFTVIMFLIG